jgi:uncharacterized OsmC-like protein
MGIAWVENSYVDEYGEEVQGHPFTVVAVSLCACVGLHQKLYLARRRAHRLCKVRKRGDTALNNSDNVVAVILSSLKIL